MFYRGQLCELDFQVLDHKQCRRPPPPVSHQIYATGCADTIRSHFMQLTEAWFVMFQMQH